MTRRSLLYHWDPRDGRMRLVGRGLHLDDHDYAALDEELRRRYESLLAGLERGEGEPVLAFDGAVAMPRRVTGFRVRYSNGSRGRCPGLVLEPVFASPPTAERREPVTRDSAPPSLERRVETAQTGPSPAPVAESRALAVRDDSPWVAGFFSDVRGRLAEKSPSRLSNSDRVALAFLLVELRNLCLDHSDDLAIILLAGYVSLGERMGPRADAEEARLYRGAARVLDKLFSRSASQAPAEAANSRSSSADRTVGTLRRITRYFGRVLGLQDDDAWE